MGNLVLTLLTIYLGLSILVTLGCAGFWIGMVAKSKKELDKIEEEIDF